MIHCKDTTKILILSKSRRDCQLWNSLSWIRRSERELSFLSSQKRIFLQYKKTKVHWDRIATEQWHKPLNKTLSLITDNPYNPLYLQLQLQSHLYPNNRSIPWATFWRTKPSHSKNTQHNSNKEYPSCSSTLIQTTDDQASILCYRNKKICYVQKTEFSCNNWTLSIIKRLSYCMSIISFKNIMAIMMGKGRMVWTEKKPMKLHSLKSILRPKSP